jgi:hypothetical protein
MKRSDEVGLIAFFLLLVAVLAIFGVLADAFGTDSRETLGERHAGDSMWRTF